MATDIFVRIENKDGEVLTEGACDKESIGAFEKVDHEEEAYVIALEHNMTLPTDDRTGQVTGSPRHKYMRIRKFVDRSSPLLAQQLVSPSELDVEFQFFRQGDSGPEHFYSINLEGANIVDIKTFSPDSTDVENDRKVLSEEITFTYGKIEWEHVICSTTAMDDAKGR